MQRLTATELVRADTKKNQPPHGALSTQTHPSPASSHSHFGARSSFLFRVPLIKAGTRSNFVPAGGWTRARVRCLAQITFARIPRASTRLAPVRAADGCLGSASSEKRAHEREVVANHVNRIYQRRTASIVFLLSLKEQRERACEGGVLWRSSSQRVECTERRARSAPDVN